MPNFRKVEPSIMKDILLTSAICVLTARVGYLELYLKHMVDKARSAYHGIDSSPEESWRRLFTESDCRLLPCYMAVSGAERDAVKAWTNSKGTSQWRTKQHTGSLLSASTDSPKYYSDFLTKFNQRMRNFVPLLQAHSQNGLERRKWLTILAAALNDSSHAEEDEQKCMFVVQQIMFDLEELCSGDNGRGSCIFRGDFIVTGYGGQQGFKAFKHSDFLGDKWDPSKSKAYMSWKEVETPSLFSQFLLQTVMLLKDSMSSGVFEHSEIFLRLLGLQWREGELLIALTGRLLHRKDIEHMICKIYLLIQKSRGQRSQGIPQAVLDYCWPTKDPKAAGGKLFRDFLQQDILEFYDSVNCFDCTVMTRYIPVYSDEKEDESRIIRIHSDNASKRQPDGHRPVKFDYYSSILDCITDPFSYKGKFWTRKCSDRTTNQTTTNRTSSKMTTTL